MMTYDRTNTGTISKNTRKTEDRHADITGTLNVEGREFYLNGWHKTNTRDGTTFYSLSVKPKEARQDAPSGAPAPGFSGGIETDDIPFRAEWR